MRRRYKGRETPIPKLCQKLRRRPPTLADATDGRSWNYPVPRGNSPLSDSSTPSLLRP